MTDTEKLKQLIKLHGYTFKFVAKKLGLSPYGFQLKVQNKSQFFTEEVLILCDLLEIKTWKEREAIFFKRNDDLKSSKVS